MQRKFRFLLTTFFLLCSVTAWAAEGPKPATEYTKQANQKFLETLPFSDKSDYDDVKRGFIATIPSGQIKYNDRVVWDVNRLKFLESDTVPDTVNPSMWRVAQLNHEAGLFKVVDKIYQFRGFDATSMTIIEGKTGVIVIDPLTSVDAAKAAMDLYYEKVPSALINGKKRPVKAVLISHPHVDHYGGTLGIMSKEEFASTRTPIIAPEGFLENAVAENVYAGTIMYRRAIYMSGRLTPPGPTGFITMGLAANTTNAPMRLVPPTDLIKRSDEKRTIDGVEIIFEMTKDTEAPVEFMAYFPQFKAVFTAEIGNSVMHNLYTLRGAQIRDATAWWRGLDAMVAKYGDKMEVTFGAHHWPRWGNEKTRAFLEGQRDVYKYLHDQTLRLANLGYTPTEIAEAVKLPHTLDQQWHTRGYYGTVSHNVKAVYQRYLGWYDGNPAHLNLLPDEERARNYVAFMGGIDEVIEKSRKSFKAGEYRWVADVMSQAVFAEPDNQEAKNLLADALEQLGYQAESGVWRNFYLTGAVELRNGRPPLGKASTMNPDTMLAMTPEMLLDYLSIKVNPEKMGDSTSATLRWVIPSTKESWDIELKNSLLMYRRNMNASTPDIVITAEKLPFITLFDSGAPLDTLVSEGKIKVDGDTDKLRKFIGGLDTFNMDFNIVMP